MCPGPKPAAVGGRTWIRTRVRVPIVEHVKEHRKCTQGKLIMTLPNIFIMHASSLLACRISAASLCLVILHRSELQTRAFRMTKGPTSGPTVLIHSRPSGFALRPTKPKLAAMLKTATGSALLTFTHLPHRGCTEIPCFFGLLACTRPQTNMEAPKKPLYMEPSPPFSGCWELPWNRRGEGTEA